MIPTASVPANTRATIERMVRGYLAFLGVLAALMALGLYRSETVGWRVTFGFLFVFTALRGAGALRSRGHVCWSVDDDGFLLGKGPRRLWSEVTLLKRTGREFVLSTKGGERLVLNVTALEQADRIADAVARRLTGAE